MTGVVWTLVGVALVAASLAARCDGANDLKLLPYPKEVTMGGELTVGPANYVVPYPSDTIGVAQRSLDSYLPDSGGSMTVRLGSVEEGYDTAWLTQDENDFLTGTETSDEAGVIKIDSSGVTVVGKGKWGMLQGVQTINQLVRGTKTVRGKWQMNATIPHLTIRDWPDMKWRCLSPAMTWYSGYNRLEGYDCCNWTLDEWKWLVDWSLLHKYNAWAMCMYGHHPFTIPGHESNELDVDSYFYNPETGQKEAWRFTHRNIRNEFLPELIQYANARGIKIHAYIGKNTFNGSYWNTRPDMRAGGAMELLPFHPEVHSYWDAMLGRCLELGFNGFVFEDPETLHVPNQTAECYEAFWEPWESTYGYGCVEETDSNKPPLDVQIEYYTWLFRTFDRMIQAQAQRLGVDPEIYLISHILVARMMAESASDAERLRRFALIDEKHGREVAFICEESNESKYVELVGGDRIASLGGRGGSCTSAMRRIASVNNCWQGGGLGATVGHDRESQRRIVDAGGFGAMGYVFEWTNTEIFGYIASQYLWDRDGVPSIGNDNDYEFLKYGYTFHYGDDVGELVARAMDEGSCVNDAMVLEGVWGAQYPETGKAIHRDYQYLAALADHASDLAVQAYELYTGSAPDLYHADYVPESYHWDGFDQHDEKLFKREALRKLCVSQARCQRMCECALAQRMARRLEGEGAPTSEILAKLDDAIEAAEANQLLYQVNYDDDYDRTDGMCHRITERLEQMRTQLVDSGSMGDSTPPVFIPWEKQSDIVADTSEPLEPGRYLSVDLGLNNTYDYYCLGVVFTVQIQQMGEWQTIFRRAVNRRQLDWEHYEIALDGIVGGGPQEVRFRFLTDSYTRAQNRSWPTWRWALWGHPQIIEVAPGGQSEAVYDFVEHVDDAEVFVRLDSDVSERPFDGVGKDSTGATFHEVGLSPVEALQQGEGSDWQWVEGFQSALEGVNVHSGSYMCYVGSAISWWGYASEGGEVAWLTAAAPEARETAAVFIGGMGFDAGQAELWCNGRRILDFDTGQDSDAVWQEGDVELRYLHGGTLEGYGNSGVFVLHVPASLVTPGEGMSLMVKMISGGSAWFMLHGYGNAMQMTGVAALPNPPMPTIAAFTPHQGEASGLTVADYDVELLPGCPD